MENEVKKCKFCGNKDESKLFVAISTDGKHEDGYECLKCSQERKCPKCGSRNIKREKGPNDFMPRKEEGEKA